MRPNWNWNGSFLSVSFALSGKPNESRSGPTGESQLTLTPDALTGALARIAITLDIPADQMAWALDIATTTRRRLPFRWHTVAILDGGRVA